MQTDRNLTRAFARFDAADRELELHANAMRAFLDLKAAEPQVLSLGNHIGQPAAKIQA